MTNKRFELAYETNRQGVIWWAVRDYDITLWKEEVIHTLNELFDENEQLKTQLQNTSDQRDEFHRGARENANRIGKLEKENEQLKEAYLRVCEICDENGIKIPTSC